MYGIFICFLFLNHSISLFDNCRIATKSYFFIFSNFHRIFSRHFVKGINKRLFKSFKLVCCPNLKLWQKTISNMIWWSISSSVGKPNSFVRSRVHSVLLILWSFILDISIFRECSIGSTEDPVHLPSRDKSAQFPSPFSVSEMSAWRTKYIKTMD